MLYTFNCSKFFKLNKNKLIIRSFNNINNNGNCKIPNILDYSFDYSLYVKTMEDNLMEQNKNKIKIEEYCNKIDNIHKSIENIQHNHTINIYDIQDKLNKIDTSIKNIEDSMRKQNMKLYQTQFIVFVLWVLVRLNG